jgi:hypothetical protein
VYALTCHATPSRIHGALEALQAATGLSASAFPALSEEAQS